MKAYSVFDREAGPQEGAVLVFASSAKEARQMGFASVRDLYASDWLDVAARWMPRMEEELARQNDVPLGALRVVESPRTCERCETWGSVLDAEGICEPCRDDEEEP